jgi:hypothetical protein
MASLARSMSAQDLGKYRLIIQGRIPRVVNRIQEGLASRPEILRNSIAVRALSEVIQKEVWDAFEHFFPPPTSSIEEQASSGLCHRCGAADSAQMRLETPTVDFAADQPAESTRTESAPASTETGGPMELAPDTELAGPISMEGDHLLDASLGEKTVRYSGNDAAIGNMADFMMSEEDWTRLMEAAGNFEEVREVRREVLR